MAPIDVKAPKWQRYQRPCQRHCLIGTVTLLVAGISASCTQRASVEEASNTLTIMGVVQNEQQDKLELALRPFEERTGIDVRYEGKPDFGIILPERVEAGNPPDIAMVPQPAVIATFAKSGDLVPLTFLDQRSLQKAYADSWLDLGAVDGVPYGLWYRASVKSLVWYNPTAFKAKGYDIPTSWDALIALSDKIVADGGTPWCVGLESEDASGWPGTDWIEDIMLRTAGPEAFDQWVNHNLPFNSPQVRLAFDDFDQILHRPSYVADGALGAITTPYSFSPLGLFESPPDCYLHRQANFVASFFPEDKQPQIDYDVFPLPGIDPEFGLPILVSGDAFVMFNDTPAARQFMAYMMTPEPHEIWAGLGGFISPQAEASLDAYPNPVSRKVAQILQDAEIVRFDGSDSMPAEVQSAFWRGMINLASGEPVEEVTQDIDDQWPQ